jgi:hypothetical protein
MEDLEPATGSPVLDNGNEPQGNDDAGDTLRPAVEEEDHAGTPPMADPMADMETRGDDGVPDGDADMNTDAAVQDQDNDDDMESDLEELDDQQFEDFDASALNIPDKPLQVDESNVGLLGVHKRKRTAEEEAERERKKKKKANRREKPKRSKRGEDEDDFEGGVEMDGKRLRKSKGGEGRSGKSGGVRRARTPEDESMLSPEERELAPCSSRLLRVLTVTDQAAVVLSIARWTRRSSRTEFPAVRLHRIWRNAPTKNWRPCVNESAKPVRQMLLHVRPAASQPRNSIFFLNSSNCSTATPSRRRSSIRM